MVKPFRNRVVINVVIRVVIRMVIRVVEGGTFPDPCGHPCGPPCGHAGVRVWSEGCKVEGGTFPGAGGPCPLSGKSSTCVTGEGLQGYLGCRDILTPTRS